MEALRALEQLEPALLEQHADTLVASLEDSRKNVRALALETLLKLEPATLMLHACDVFATLWHETSLEVLTMGDQVWDLLEPAFVAQHVHIVLARLEDSRGLVRRVALKVLAKLDPEMLAQHASAVVARLEDSEPDVRSAALRTLGQLEPATLAQYADAVLARLGDTGLDYYNMHYVRKLALRTLGTLEPAKLAEYADAVLARLDDNDGSVRSTALETLGQLDPATLALHADAVVARLEDSEYHVRNSALGALASLEPAKLALHAGAVVARLEDDAILGTRLRASWTLRKLEPAALARHANAVVATLRDSEERVRAAALDLLGALPRFVTRPFDMLDPRGVRARLLGRLAWYRCRLRLRAQHLALYWYALPYRPSGPGHARDVEAWDRMTESQDHQVGITPAATRRKRCKTDTNAGTQQNERQTRLRSRNTKSPRSES